jgi:hypothetical protein
MTERQRALLKYLKENTIVKGVSRETIQRDLDGLYPSNGAENHYYDQAYSQITKDIQGINDDDLYDGFIISKPGDIKLATETEHLEALERERAMIIRKLVRLHKKINKAKRNDNLRFNLTTEEVELVKSLI